MLSQNYESFFKGDQYQINFPLCLAPMVGLSHFGLRQLIKEYLPEGAKTLWPTEMLNSRRLPNEKVGWTPETYKFPNEVGLVPQILGNQEKEIVQSLEKLIEWGAVGVDINMGCPVQKALKHNYGVALMGDPLYAESVVRITVRNSTVPVSVKIRSVEKNTQLSNQKLLDFALRIQDAGAQWITLHPRTAEEKRRDSADWSQIQFLKSKIKIPVIGNGDIQTFYDVIRMKSETGCDMVMSGRALAARPWMVWQLGEALNLMPSVYLLKKQAPQTPEEEAQEYGRSLIRLAEILEEGFQKIQGSEELALRKLRFHVKTTHVWLDFGHQLFSLIGAIKTIQDFKDQVEIYFKKYELKMFPHTDLRQ